MPRKPKKRPAVKAARPAVRRKARRSPPDAAEIAQLASIIEKHRESESAWLKLSVPSEEEDRWGALEDHLLAKGQRRDSDRRWKYFSK